MKALEDYERGDEVRVVRTDGMVETWYFCMAYTGSSRVDVMNLRDDDAHWMSLEKLYKTPTKELFLHWQEGGMARSSEELATMCRPMNEHLGE